MKDIFDMLFGAGTKPVRRTVRLQFTVDQDGQPVVVPIDGDFVSLSALRSLDNALVGQDSFFH
ncbi:MAG: hypothetical protein HY287_15055 [Planctomycetes bacterium]|nr:hypothetical protein [Planctomycetota bacterium]